MTIRKYLQDFAPSGHSFARGERHPATLRRRMTALRSNLLSFSCAMAGLVLCVSSAQAADGRWILNNSGTWSTEANWADNEIANGAGNTADFSTINITTANRTVTLDSSRTIGHLKFGDTTPSHNWILDASGGSVLTLEVSTGIPGIEVVNQTATLSLELAGNQGLTKTGAGTLVLGGGLANAYTGTTTVNDGTLSLGKTAASLDAFGGDLHINGGTVNYSTANNEQIANTANVTLSSGLLAIGARTETLGQTSPLAGGSFMMSGGNLTIGSGQLNLNRNPVITGGTITLTAASGALVANQELIFNGGVIDFTSASGSSSAALNLRGGAGTGVTYESTGTAMAQIINSGGGSARLSLNTSGTTVFTIADAPTVDTEMSIGVNISGSTALEKNGAGVLLLSGPSTYSGSTTIKAGTLLIGANAPSGSAGALGNTTSAVLLGDTTGSASAALLTEGAVSVARAVTVQAGGSGTATLGGNTADISTFSGNVTANKDLQLTAANDGEAVFSGVISGNGKVAVVGGGTVVLEGVNNYTGGTTLSEDTTLRLGAEDVLPDTGTFTFAGGILAANNRTDTIGQLSLTADSSLNLSPGGTAGALTFASAAWTSGTLTINGWTGTPGGTGSDDRIYITTAPEASFLNHVYFDLGGNLYFADMIGNELVAGVTPVPEPVNVALGVFGVMFAAIGLWRRHRASRSL